MGFFDDLKKGAGAVAGLTVKITGAVVSVPVGLAGKAAEALGADEFADGAFNIANGIIETGDKFGDEVEEVVEKNIGTVATAVVGGLMLDEARKERDKGKKST